MRSLIAFLLTCGAACAQDCLPPDQVTDYLQSGYGEDLALMAERTVEGDEGLLLFYGNPDGTSWTAILVVDGCARPLVAGNRWQQIVLVPGQDG